MAVRVKGATFPRDGEITTKTRGSSDERLIIEASGLNNIITGNKEMENDVFFKLISCNAQLVDSMESEPEIVRRRTRNHAAPEMTRAPADANSPTASRILLKPFNSALKITDKYIKY